jgi:hypothetical protein
MIYQIAMTEANKFEKLVFWMLADENEQAALQAYAHYRAWLDIASDYMKGK